MDELWALLNLLGWKQAGKLHVMPKGAKMAARALIDRGLKDADAFFMALAVIGLWK